MATGIEEAYSIIKTGAEGLMAEWAARIPADVMSEFEAVISAGGQTRIQIDSGERGKISNVSAWLMDSGGEQVFLLFSFAPGENLKGVK